MNNGNFTAWSGLGYSVCTVLHIGVGTLGYIVLSVCIIDIFNFSLGAGFLLNV